MTLNNATRSISYAGAGSAGPFAFPFKIFDATHLVVTKTVVATGVVTTVPADDYTVSGVRRASGNVLMDAVVPVGTTLTIRRRPPLTQLVSIRNQGTYYPDVVEDEFDLLVMQVQGSADDVDEILDTFDDRMDAFDVRLTTVEEQIQELIDAQVLEQAAAALPVPVLLDAAIDEVSDASVMTRWQAGLSWEIDVSLDPSMDPLEDNYPQEFTDPGSDLKHMLQGLEPDTDYYARIRTKRGPLVSGNSNIITFHTEPLFAATSSADLVTYDETTDISTHFFTTPGAQTFEVVEGSRGVRGLLVGAGGMGGGTNGSGNSCGGGGGGGVRELAEDDWPELGVGVHALTVGARAAAAIANNVGVNGGNSVFNGITAKGGGFGGSLGAVVGAGGCGGGAVNSSGTAEAGGRGTTSQGNDGGNCPAVGNGGGAGGGGAALDQLGEDGGGTASGQKGGDGGDGYESDISGVAVRYGAGGGGARPCDAFGVTAGTTPGLGGNGGGGAGSNGNSQGAAGTGIGSGGGGAHGNFRGGLGTNGTVIIAHRGKALNITPVIEVVPPPDPFWRGPITGPGDYDDGLLGVVHVDIAYFEDDATNATAMHSTDNPVLGQHHTPGAINDFSSFPYPAYYAGNMLGFKFDREIRRFRITRKNGDGTIRHVIFAADTGGDEQFFGVGYAANGGVTNSGSKYLKFFNVTDDDRQEVAWVSGDSFKVVIVRQQVPAWGDGSGGYPDAIATVPDIYYDAYFLLTSDPEVPGEDTWEP